MGAGTRRALSPLVALLLGLVVLGGLAWALTRGTSGGDTPGAGGAQWVEVPGLAGLPLEEARGRLGDAGLELGSQTEAASDEVADGAVIEHNPAAGTEAERGTAVDVVVSTGPAPEPTTPSSSASSSATASASASSAATAPASTPPAGEAGAGQGSEEAREKAQEAAEQAQEAREEAKEREKERKEAQKERGKE